MLRNRVRELRARHHYSQTELGKLIGVTRQTIGLIEKEDYEPSVRLALKLAIVFDLPLEDIFWLEDK
ncbi:helix-turn-helix transcriptional regulator [Pseudogracilibacillus auburnensis]|uniref:Putative transcriptional regulator n=1 Tax=Pseudogracilibacillus auburnensis TaxID=1494959 RepID=A0A2V3W5J8_9BACI|nr:helix-turn-helix transcriptional regulator [Pseudogracilibacillus auburnensis]MBO1002207.1 helix-turn-helix transcriptional regulator [Pseudogracilibacillus auburnensis]PXW87535.1 putative transcriptional regulator [Pseudogracilibacillus auburnensis]